MNQPIQNQQPKETQVPMNIDEIIMAMEDQWRKIAKDYKMIMKSALNMSKKVEELQKENEELKKVSSGGAVPSDVDESSP